MKIRTQFTINVVVLGIVLLLMTGVVITTSRWLENTDQQQEAAAQIEREANELSILANDYLLYHEPQQASRWEAKFASLSESLSKLPVNAPEQRVLVENIKTNQQRLKTVFADVRESIEENSQTQETGISEAFTQVAWSRMEVQTQEMIFKASQLEQVLREQNNELTRRANLLNLSFITGFGAFLLVIYWSTFQRMLQGIARLQAGTQMIGAGDLDFSIPVKNGDEIGELAYAFNRMTANLKKVTASKTDLEREMAERKQAEEALRLSERRFRSVFENAATGIAIASQQGQFQICNPAFSQLLGYTQEELCQLNFASLIHPDDLETNLAETARLKRGEVPFFALESRYVRKDGKVVWTHKFVCLLPETSDGQVLALVTDITQRKTAGEALRLSEEKFSKAFHASPDAILITRLRDGKLMEVNEGFSRLTGYTAQEAMTSSSLNLGLWVNAQDREAFITALREKHKVQDQEYDFRVKSGKILNCLCSSEIIQLGGEAHVLSVIHDITERKQAEEALHRYELLSEHSRDIILFMRHDDGQLLEVNRAATQAYGYSREEMLELTVRNLRAANTLGLTAEQMEQADVNGILFETVHRRKDGSTFPVEVSSQGATIGSRRVLVSIVRDISERKQAERANEWLASFPARNPNPIVEIDSTGAVFYVNPTAQGLFPELATQGFKHPWLGNLEDMIARLQQEGIHKLQREVQIDNDWYTQILYHVPEVGRVRVYGTEINQLKRVEEALRTAYQRFHIILSRLYGGILVVNNDNRIEFVNQAFCNLFALDDSPEELLDLHAPEMIQKILDCYADPSVAIARIHEILANGQPLKGEEIAMADGRTYLRDFIPIQVNGKLYGRMWNHIDITERKHAEEALRQSEENFSKAFRSSPAALMITRLADGCFLELNDAYCAVVGYEREELLGQRTTDFNIFVNDTDRQAILEQLQASGSIRGFETSIYHRSGAIRHVIANQELITFDNQACIMTHLLDITGRRQMEEAIRVSEERFRFALTNSPIVVANLDRELKYTWVYNPMAGFQAEDLVGKQIGLSTDPQTREKIIGLLGELLANGTSPSWETMIQTASGMKFFTSQAEPLRNPQNEITGIALLSIDITERKEMEEALRADEERYRAVVDSALDAIIVSDPSGTGRILSANPEACRMFGYEADELVGLSREDILDTSDPNLATLLKERERNGRATAELSYKRKDGTQFSGELSTAYYQDRNGEQRSVAIIRDVTERRQAAENIQRSEAMLRSVLDQMPSGVTVRSAQTGDLLLSNARGREIMGSLVASASQFSQYRGFHPDGSPYQSEEWPLYRSLATGEIVHAEEATYERSDGTRITLNTNAAPVRDPQGRIIMGVSVFDDISERKLAEEALQRTTEDLRRSNAELEQFAYIASHDLQEPLRMVSSYVQLLSRRYHGRLDQDADEFIDYAVDGAKRMQNLINDLLIYSRVGTRGKPLVPTSCEAALEEAISNLQIAIEESGAGIVHETLPLVKGDPTQLVQLFQNLLSNALKFHAAEPPQIHIGVQQEAGEWLFRVSDKGIGLDPKFSERIFVLFQRLHQRDAYPGTGIGLAICKRIVQRHGGRIWVESQPGNGATFYFTLPIKETE